MTVLVNFSGEQELSVLLNELYVKNLPVDRLYTIVTNCCLSQTPSVRCNEQISWRDDLKVTFAGEPAVNNGGPLREFFHLLIKNLSEENKLLCGPYDCRTPRKNIVKFQKNSFFQLGKMIARSMSLVHGGPAPHFFSPAVADFICYGMFKVISDATSLN